MGDWFGHFVSDKLWMDHHFMPKIHSDEFLRKNLITLRFIFWINTLSISFDRWSEQQQKKFWSSRLWKMYKNNEKNLKSSLEYACNLWIYIQDLFKDKTHHRECIICCEKRPAIVSECGHCACIQCFEILDNCHICRIPIDHSELMNLKDALQIGRPVFT